MIVVGVLGANAPEQVAGIVAAFCPDEVPVLDHHHGTALGWVRAIVPEGPSVWFVAALEDADLAARLRLGPVPISLEMAGRGVLPTADERGVVLPWMSTTFRGRVGSGWTLTAVAVLRPGERPGANGSALWLVES